MNQFCEKKWNKFVLKILKTIVIQRRINHIHSTEKSVLKNKTCISLWPVGSGICLTIQAKYLIPLHLPLSYFPPPLFVFHHSLLHCPLANGWLFNFNLYQVILRFAALFTRWFAISWQKFQALYFFKVAETLTTELMSAFDVRRNCRDIYLFIKDCLICIFYCTISTVYFNDSNMNQFRCEQNVTDEYNFTSFFPLMKK